MSAAQAHRQPLAERLRPRTLGEVIGQQRWTPVEREARHLRVSPCGIDARGEKRGKELVGELYHSGIDRSKLGQWIAAHDLVGGCILEDARALDPRPLHSGAGEELSPAPGRIPMPGASSASVRPLINPERRSRLFAGGQSGEKCTGPE